MFYKGFELVTINRILFAVEIKTRYNTFKRDVDEFLKRRYNMEYRGFNIKGIYDFDKDEIKFVATCKPYYEDLPIPSKDFKPFIDNIISLNNFYCGDYSAKIDNPYLVIYKNNVEIIRKNLTTLDFQKNNEIFINIVQQIKSNNEIEKEIREKINIKGYQICFLTFKEDKILLTLKKEN